MVKKHESSIVIEEIPVDLFITFYNDAIRAISRLDTLYKQLTEFETEDIDEDELYDILDDFSIRISTVCQILHLAPSTDLSMNKYLLNTAESLEQLIENINNVVENGVYPSVGDVGILKREIYEVIGGLSYYTVVDFNVPEVLQSATNNETVSVDEVLDAYIKQNSLDLTDFCKRLLKYYKEYRLKLEFFDEHPELEHEFELTVGPTYNVIPDGVLTVDLVQKVIDGEVSVSDLEAMLNVE